MKRHRMTATSKNVAKDASDWLIPDPGPDPGLGEAVSGSASGPASSWTPPEGEVVRTITVGEGAAGSPLMIAGTVGSLKMG